ncbi:glycosyltransferase family 2 protein [Geobacter sp. DSM 9736]|uniref:glycosyltransferase family 2 protein n=1 Tax=Geobacter sp. DSM 9736 TaxID=1277350 RepID=UPI000B603B7F|nr:glycosyltransferase family 2 protein [Geobacter sp. DSM 9736]SNB45023.1 Glycosyltransferase involved in cell wall bisynthesis [Geobacter sp. DSM 9736]
MTLIERPRLSAFVITKNEGAKILECLGSLQWVDEVVVVDDYSTDDTVPKCSNFANVRVVHHPFASFRDQKSHAMSLTSNEWVLEIDADERVSNEMKSAVLALSQADFSEFDAFAFRRLTNFWGKWIRHGSFYPDYKVRLYNKRNGAWSDSTIHERFVPRGKIKRIAADIIHDQDLDLTAYFQRTTRYSELSALDYHSRGKRSKWHHYTLRPVYTFFYRYLFRLGCLDGVQGFVVSAMGAIGTFQKYMRLFELQKGRRRV